MGLYSLFLVALCLKMAYGNILTPPYFNLAEGRNIEATATCGVNVTNSKELFCRLTGASADERQELLEQNLYYAGNNQIIMGQLCDWCQAEGIEDAVATRVHSPRFAIDGTERWWQSPPLSRGSQYNNVNLTIDLGQEFHVAYVYIKMGNSPRPGVWALERSMDNGETWSTWQYFADTPSDCLNFFGQDAQDKPTRDGDVICTNEFSNIVPLEGGEIAVSLVQDRPGSVNFSYSPELQEFTKATNVRLSLMRTKTLLGHLMLLARQDPTVTRRYFYSVKDVSIGGRCVCNGHADVCDKKQQFKLVCDCQHNTCGDQCERCCEPYVQKKWTPAVESNTNACEPCQCYDHTSECVYNETVDFERRSIDIHGNYEGGGVCQNCQDNTMGINCDQCIPGFYRPFGVSLYAKDVCQACRCDPIFTTGDCEDETGKCYCKPQYTGPDCQECAYGYYNPPECFKCDCFLNGTVGAVCEVGGGQCPCLDNFAGKNCSECAPGFWKFPECIPCTCDMRGALNEVGRCDDKTGQCECDYRFDGLDCGHCKAGYYQFPNCNYCDCDFTGTEESVCDKENGTCECTENFAGKRCDQCAPGYFNYPECRPCRCAVEGSDGTSCSDLGQCRCQRNFGGLKCDSCAPGYHNYPTCLSCDCNLFGSIGRTCDQGSAQCDCRSNFAGLKCDKCSPDFYNFPRCEACSCNPAGAEPVPGYPLGGCGSFNDGFKLCECKARVFGHICDQCQAGHWNLNIRNPDGCEDCDCHTPGTLLGDNMCDPVSGQCYCKVNVNSRRCSTCVDGTFNLQESSLFGCEDCDCDLGGAVNGRCQKSTGQCECRHRVTGRTCSKPLDAHYFPTLHQMKYEIEDGINPTDSDSAVRFGFDKDAFPDYSWRGYAVFSRVQPEVRVTVTIEKPSVFRIILRFANRNFASVNAKLVVTPENPSSDEVNQSRDVLFPPTTRGEPEFLTVGGNPFVMNPGKYTVSLKTEQDMDVDYLVLLPQAYTEAAILQNKVRNPCMIPSTDGTECLHYVYVDVSQYPTQDAGEARLPNGEEPDMEDNRDLLIPLNYPNLAQIKPGQETLVFNVTLDEPGLHTFVLGYLSRRNAKQSVTVLIEPEGDNSTLAVAVLYECQYSSLCRQVVIDMDGGHVTVNATSVNVTVTITGDELTDSSINYVTAIPADKWDKSMLKPSVKCIMVRGKCVESTYPIMPEVVKVEAETNHNVTDMLPPDVSEDAGLVKLCKQESDVMVPVQVKSNSYIIVVTYYQPNDISFPVNVTVDVNGVMYTGYFDAEYCPNTIGCRGVIQFDDILIESHVLEILSNDLMVKFHQPQDNCMVWLDFLELLPSSLYNPKSYLMLDPFDLSGKFLSECTSDNFFIDAERGNITPFCRSSIFSMTTEYNNGALPCECNALGSESFKCTEFGGQCRCKEHIIGRTCSACEQNYYGFPDCKPCDCPGTCNAETGACECPKKVTGENCTECIPMTFGFDRTIGCIPCDCQEEGVLNGKLECDLDIGQCDCKPNVVGRKCDACLNGFWDYPECTECECDPAGTTQTICKTDTSECLCKENTDGYSCGECKSGTYNLEARNHQGCTKCFCFGITSTCYPSALLRDSIANMTGWMLTNQNTSVELRERGDSVTADTTSGPADGSQAMYWIAPPDYTGNKLTSYGGMLKYTVSNFNLDRGDTPSGVRVPSADVKITRGDTIIIYEFLSPMMDKELAIDIRETSWHHLEDGAPVTREQLMTVLARVDKLEIKANYYTDVPEVSLMSVSLDTAVEPTDDQTTNMTGASRSFDSDIALTVESCFCPANYKGTSCEDCAEGFYRQMDHLGNFACAVCECHGHSGTCDPETGVCYDCGGNTKGDHCEECKIGYTGNPLLEACIICACPMPLESNNFAKDCVISDTFENRNTVACDCLPGYMPPFCDECGPGFYGDPRDLDGGSCNLCSCNGNIDASDPNSCDSDDGECLICLNNTQGSSCEECSDMYWGDAIENKNCTDCDCDSVGTDYCNKTTGQCVCKPNVVGERCDQCAPDTWGFLSGTGCSFCNCSLAANSSQCDLLTGDCHCMPGATGKLCSSCLHRHWDYSADGCTECECELDGAVGCSVLTGICQCLHGVTGDRCDRCEDRWVLLPNQGCEPCGNCVHTLLDDTDSIQMDVANSTQSLAIINIGVEAKKKLEKLNARRIQLEAELENVPEKALDYAQLLLIKTEFAELQALANNADGDSQDLRAKSESTISTYTSVLEQMDKTNMTHEDGKAKIMEILEYMKKKYNDVISSSDLVNADKLLRDSLEIYKNMQARDEDLSSQLNETEIVSDNANEVMELVQAWQERTTNVSGRFEALSKMLSDTSSRLNDLLDKAEQALINASRTDDLLMKVKDKISDLVQNSEKIKDVNEEIGDTLEMASELTAEAMGFVTNATEAYQSLEEELTILEMRVVDLDEFSDVLVVENKNVMPSVEEAKEHAMMLRKQADNLESLLRDTNEASEAAIKAANAYDTIVKSINRAMNASKDALEAAREAIKQSTDIRNNTEEVRADSQALFEEAERAKNETQDGLRSRLDNSKKTVDGLGNSNREVEQKLEETIFQLGLLTPDQDKRAENASEQSRQAQSEVADAVDSVQPILDTVDEDLEKVNEIRVLQSKMDLKLGNVRTHLETIRSNMPNVADNTADLTKRKPKLQEFHERLSTDIDALREKIRQAREMANKMNIALKFSENTTLQLRAPEEMLDSFKQSSDLAMYFQTNQSDGLLMYIGPKVMNNAVEEYLALELDKGQVVWRYSLGAEPAEIRSNKNNYNDGKWHKVVATRSGKEGTLTVRTEDKLDDESSGSAGGFVNQLDLLYQATKIFAGGVPNNFSLPSNIRNRRFVGALDDLTYSENDIPLGLWNFEFGEENNMGTYDRGQALPEPVKNAVMFRADQQSYITINKGSLVSKNRFEMGVTFTTLNKNGLLFFLGQDAGSGATTLDYFKLYLEDGKIGVSIQLGAGEFSVQLPDLVADGKKHVVQVVQLGDVVRLKLSDDNYADGQGPPSTGILSIGASPELHIGGIPRDSKYKGRLFAEHPYFDGCISDFEIDSQKKNIMKSYVANVGTVPGCNLVKRRVTFKDRQEDQDESVLPGGYVHYPLPSKSINEEFTLGLRIKTVAEDGLLFYASDDDGKHAFSVSLKDGLVVVINTAGATGDGLARRNSLSTNETFNDGAWHHIAVTKIGLQLTIVVDDKYEVTHTADHRGKKTRTSEGYGFYLAGLPDTFVDAIVDKGNSATWKRYIGCLDSVSIRSETVDFAENTPMGENADYSACPVSDPIDPDATTTVAAETTSSGPLQCVLPRKPDTDLLTEEGIRFGSDSSARLEYSTFADFQSDVRKEIRLNNNVKFRVKTHASEGILWFVGSLKDQPDYSVVYLNRGFVVYKCNLGSGPGTAESYTRINDGQWHTVEILRVRDGGVLSGSITVDGVARDAAWKVGATSLNVDLPIYIGGLDLTETRGEYMVEKLGKSSMSSLVGCIDGLQYRGKGEQEWRDYGVASNEVNTKPCYQEEEDGVFVPEEGGLVIVREKFKVGQSRSVELSVRPRSDKGTVVGVWGGGDYLIIELFEGKVFASTNNGAGNIEVSVDVPDICDGYWHTIQVKKQKNLMTLTVTRLDGSDEVSNMKIGAAGSTSADTTSPLYVGSMPPETPGLSYKFKSDEGYVGCLRAVKVDSVGHNLSNAKTIGAVSKACPTN